MRLLPPLLPSAKTPWRRRMAGSEASKARSQGQGLGATTGETSPCGIPVPAPPSQGGEGDDRSQACFGRSPARKGQRHLRRRPSVDPELAKQLGFTTEEEDAAAMARPARNKMEVLGVAVTAHALERADPRRPSRIQGRGRPAKVWTRTARRAREIRRRRDALSSSPTTSRRATSRPRSPTWSKASGATTAHKFCSASPEAARPTPWPR